MFLFEYALYLVYGIDLYAGVSSSVFKIKAQCSYDLDGIYEISAYSREAYRSAFIVKLNIPGLISVAVKPQKVGISTLICKMTENADLFPAEALVS